MVQQTGADSNRSVHLSRILDAKKATLFGVIILVFVFFTIFAPNFFTAQNLMFVILKVSTIIIVATAATLLMVTGNFDLSVGSVLAFSGIMHAFMAKHGVPSNLSVVFAIGWGMLFGYLNGLTVAHLRVTPVIATLATMYIARGFAFLVARWDGGANISAGLPQDFSSFGRTMIGPLPLLAIIMIVLVAIFIFIERKTVLGRFIFAMGSNPEAARLSGINVPGIITWLYIITGAFAGLCGAIQTSRIGMGSPQNFKGFEFDVLIALILGGTSLKGGEGSIVGMVLGAFIVGIVGNGLNLMNVSPYYQLVFNGSILIIAVMIYQGIGRQMQ
jgi:ribose/xylose/arabinose/galactoside ABC-type transport system permease subunit